MLLSNTPPFYGATEDDLIEKIFEARVTFDGPVWETVSLEAKMLIKKLLNVSSCMLVHTLSPRSHSTVMPFSQTLRQDTLPRNCWRIHGSSRASTPFLRKCTMSLCHE